MALALAAVALCPLAAQVTQTGIIAGQIIDSEGYPVIAAVVSVTNVELIGGRVVTYSDVEGKFRIPGLPPGIYEIEIEAEGYQTLQLEEVRLKLYEVVNLNLKLTPLGETPVPQERLPLPMIDIDTFGGKVAYGPDRLRQFPLDDWYSLLTKLVPGAVPVDGGIAFAGSSPRDSALIVNGLDIRDPFSGLSARNVQHETITEIEIGTSMLDSSLGQSSGGTVSIITRARNDEISGELSTSVGLEFLSAKNDPSAEKPPYESLHTGAAFDGPMLNERAWVQAALGFDRIEKSNPATRLLPRTDSGYVLSAKGLFLINDRTELNLAYSRSDYESEHAVSPNTALWSVIESEPELSASDSSRSTDVLSAGSRYDVSDTVRFFIEAGRLSGRSENKPSSGNTDQPSVLDDRIFELISGPLQSEWDENAYSRWMMSGGLEYYLDELAGTHEIDLGLEAERSVSDSTRGYSGDYRIVYRDGLPFYRESLQNADGETGAVTSRMVHLRFSVFGRDDWSPFANLSIHLGVRYDGSTIENSATRVVDWDEISPRIGMSWDPLGDSVTAIRLGYARYHSPAINARAPSDPYAIKREYYSSTLAELGFIDGKGVDRWGSRYDTLTRYGYADGWKFADLETEAPETEELLLIAERELGYDTAASFNIVRRHSYKLLEDVETNLWDYYTSALATDSNGERYSYMVRNPGRTGSYFPILYWTNDERLKRDYFGVGFSLMGRPLPFLRGRLQYLWSKTEGHLDTTLAESSSISVSQNAPSLWQNAYGLLSSHRRHDLKLLLTATAPRGINVATIVSYNSGIPYDRLLFNPDLFSYIEEIRADPRGTVYCNEAVFNVDVRLEKSFGVREGMLGVTLDIFNLFNNDAVIQSFDRDGERFGEPLARTEPRSVKLGLRYSF